MQFNDLVNAIGQAHVQLNSRANKTINLCATLRNWVIGAYIQEYEQKGSDRAQYGTALLTKLAEKLKKQNIPGCSERYLQLFRLFYQTYPTIWQTVSAEFKSLLGKNFFPQISQTASAKSATHPKIKGLDANTLLTHLSFSHFVEMIKINDPLKRAFYELECIKCTWAVRELRRQIGSLYYERVGLSKNKEKLVEMVRSKKLPEQPSEIIRDPYIFEFLGLKPSEIMLENDLRDALVMKLQEFILELGKGFCFEARNKRVLIGGEYFFIDLVFYHKILKTNVLIELKLRQFKQGDISQLDSYLNYYKENEMTEGDKPPVGILLCTEKNHALVKYALAGMDNQLFVSEYSLQLPSQEEMSKFLERSLEQEISKK
ncbi:MAG: PDDEXK nuclease domain-containing protein [Pseudomonadota bacterium]